MKESDWHVISKDIVELQQPRNVQAELDIVISDIDQNKKRQSTENQRISTKAELMTVGQFKEEMSQANEDYISKTIQNTGTVADGFYNQIFRKWQRH